MNHLVWPGWGSLTVISGVAMGGGCDLALHGQERWGVAARPDGRRGLHLAHPAAKHGILTGFGGTVRLPAQLGQAGADRLFRDFETWDSRQALSSGAIHRSIEPEVVKQEILVWLSGGSNAGSGGGE
jgi:enoyl-CoA hydratase